ncbi:toxin-antitoxin system YwqK family antitoxin [Fibrella arboris]|uniref:toxin-antitoxin system YwqK family antitoxin n=1 Tax=Fibrella arboris TaxID=3242486 RepID=UPI0035213659
MFRYFLFSLGLFATYTTLAQTAPSALTTAGGPPVAVPKKQKGSFLKKVAEQAGVPAAVAANPLSTTAYGLPGSIPNKDSVGSMLSDMLGSSIPDLGLKINSFKKNKGDKREKKKVSKTDYEGLPMIRQFIKIGSGDRTIVEEFNVLKTWQDPNPYVRETFGYSPKEARIKPLTKDMTGVYLMHGPYKRYQNGDLVEEGFYYLGAKDGRWEKYDAKFMLTDKVRYYHGFPADSRITYYDSAHTKVKEVFPYEYGRLKGTYLAFHANGQLAEEGKYDNGVKVGRWTEYYATGTRRFRRRVTQYAKDRWEADVEPVVLSEWDEKGKLTYERPKEKTSSAEEEEEAQ